jgi:glycosyltransferase involved in cell wall biosynthesis
VLLDHPVQHFTPGLRLLAGDVNLTVYYWNEAREGQFDPGFGRHVRWSDDLHSGYRWWCPPDGPAWRRHLALLGRLRDDRPDVLLCFGWSTACARTGMVFAGLSRVPLLYYGDSNLLAPSASRRLAIRRRILRRLFRSAGALSTGTYNREFYLAHGMDHRRIHAGVYPTDIESFRTARNRRPPANPADGDRPLVIGFCGKFIAIKGVGDLVMAAARLPRDRNWELWLIGDGPLRPAIEALITEHGLADRTRMFGFRNTDKLPELFAQIDIMVMPSRREPRGLVAIEALAAGAAVVVSSATGLWGPGDVIDHGRTGMVFPTGDTGALADVLLRLLEDPALRDRLSTAGQIEAVGYGPVQFAATAAAALLATAREDTGVHHH